LSYDPIYRQTVYTMLERARGIFAPDPPVPNL